VFAPYKDIILGARACAISSVCRGRVCQLRDFASRPHLHRDICRRSFVGHVAIVTICSSIADQTQVAAVGPIISRNIDRELTPMKCEESRRSSYEAHTVLRFV
jgi:hypothetical protein